MIRNGDRISPLRIGANFPIGGAPMIASAKASATALEIAIGSAHLARMLGPVRGPSLAAAIVVAGLLSSSALAQPFNDWKDAFEAFSASDLRRGPPTSGIVFVGSSSIRMWSGLEGSFAGNRAVLNRGFGGSQLSDCERHVDQLVVKYRPRAVFVYAGDNDIAAGVRADEVLERFKRLAATIRTALPDTRVMYISIKPSPARASLLPEIRRANALIRDYAESEQGVGYVDVFTAMLDEAGKPRRDLYLADDLHLNADGYALWQRIIEPHVRGA